MTGNAVNTVLSTVHNSIFSLPTGALIMVIGIAVLTLFLDIRGKK